MHRVVWPSYSKQKDGRKYFKRQCYTDGEQCDFDKLDKWFPESLFILNKRPKREWLNSRIKHVMMGYREGIDVDSLYAGDRYGKMAKDFFFDEKSAILKWICERRIYHKQVRSYFKDNKNFIEIDVTTNKNWINDTVNFIKSNEFRIIENISIKHIHENKRGEHDLTNKGLLLEYQKMVDDIIDLVV